MSTKNLSDIPKAYNPGEVEKKWYQYWEENKLFHSEVDNSKESYTIVIPPPNVTGMLHLGHVLNNTIQDVYIRYKRMMGFNACWVPGTDHASIATESKVIKMLKDQGIDKYDIGREKFLEHCWEWTNKYGGIIIKQLRTLGISCDWDRQRFTMDDEYYKKVVEAFVELYNQGYIYRGHRMVNWCPASKSAISDEEVEYKEINGKLWHFRYPIAGEEGKYVVIATTRPETMLGDTAVAVNPNDERYNSILGKKILLPIVNKEIPIVEDDYVDIEFGTGVVKITPAHDINDYELGKRHDLEVVNIFNEDATGNNNVPEEYRGMDRNEMRKKIVAAFEEMGLVEKIEDYTHKVGYSQRGGVPIEPYLSDQWFMKMDDLAKPAVDVVENGDITFHPNHWSKTYMHWMTNIKDWCISRQLWWGHQIPVWYHKETGEIYCSTEPPKDVENYRQEQDVLDTWASSWLWAHDVFTTEEEQKYYYPTDLLVTAPDIIFFWVARMIIAGKKFMGDIPFKDVYFTSIIRDGKGRKMSKSLGNSPDPIDVMDEYGADALRFTINYIAPLGQDVLFDVEKCEIGRNFANKIWNAGRFLLMNSENIKYDESLVDKHVDFTDKWIISRFHETIKSYNDALDKFEINGATKILYAFIWNDFCDWYVELAKNRMYSDDEEVKSAVLTRSLKLFGEMMTILHPFMPFISEEIWNLLPGEKTEKSISVTRIPTPDSSKIDKEAVESFETVRKIVSAIRNIRGEMNIPPSKKIAVHVKADNISEAQTEYIKSLAKAGEVIVGADIAKPTGAASAVVPGCEIFIPLEGLIDVEAEKARVEKEINRIEGALKGVDKKLSNKKFVDNAPADVVEREKAKQSDWQQSLAKLKSILEDLK